VITDPDQVRPVVITWRTQLSDALKEELAAPLDWDEGPDAPYFTGRPAWDCFSDLLLWAAYDDHPDLERPAASVEDWTADPAYQRSLAKGSGTRYPHLLKGAEWWLPADFEFSFSAPDPAGNSVVFGSAPALVRNLELLNDRTWRADDAAIRACRRQELAPQAPLEAGARAGFALFLELARHAVEHRLVVLLDY
jgi:hypothetical protein